MQHIICIIIKIQELSFLKIFVGASEYLHFFWFCVFRLFMDHLGALVCAFFLFIRLTFINPSLLIFILIRELILKIFFIGLLVFLDGNGIEWNIRLLFFHLLRWFDIKLLNFACWFFYFHYFGVGFELLELAFRVHFPLLIIFNNNIMFNAVIKSHINIIAALFYTMLFIYFHKIMALCSLYNHQHVGGKYGLYPK